MSLTARLHIEGHSLKEKGIKVLACDFNFFQDVDSLGKINSDVRAGTINLTIPGICDAELIQWMTGKDIRRDGTISFSGVVDTGPRKSIEFFDGVLVSYHESFTDQSDIVTRMSISTRKIIVYGITHEIMWDPGEGDV